MKHPPHTPGPWWRGKQSANGYTVRVNDPGCTYGRIVAETMEPDDANAIAALPDLLAALKRADILLTELRAYDLDAPEDIETLAMIEAALAKFTPEGSTRP